MECNMEQRSHLSHLDTWIIDLILLHEKEINSGVQVGVRGRRKESFS
jgi:hypothetical protein